VKVGPAISIFDLNFGRFVATSVLTCQVLYIPSQVITACSQVHLTKQRACGFAASTTFKFRQILVAPRSIMNAHHPISFYQFCFVG
jgi:hypothetical protein